MGSPCTGTASVPSLTRATSMLEQPASAKRQRRKRCFKAARTLSKRPHKETENGLSIPTLPMNATTTPLPLIKKGDRPFLHLFLFLATVGTAFLSFLYGPKEGEVHWADFTSDERTGAALFAVSALTIMLAH